jgi:UDP-glucose 4-epimerase
MKKEVLITGAAGFIGAATAKKFLNFANVITIDNLSTGYLENLPTGVIFYKGDISDRTLVERVFNENNIDYIIHIAGQSSGEISFDSPEYDLSTNTLSTLHLLDMANKFQIKKFIYISTMSVYGNKNAPCAEDIICSPMSFYGVGKYASEQYLRIYKEQYDIDYICLRLFNIYGPGQNLKNLRQGMASIFLAQLLESNHINVHGSLERYRDMVYIDDVVNVIEEIYLMTEFPCNVLNIGTGIKTTVKSLIKLIALNLNMDDLVINQPTETQGDIFGITSNTERFYKYFPDFKFTLLKDGIKKMVDHEK